MSSVGAASSAAAVSRTQSEMAASEAAQTASFTTPSEADLQAMRKGADFTKYCKRSKPHARVFRVDTQSEQVLWSSPRKNQAKCVVNLDDVREIREGQHTKTFKSRPGLSDATLSFSVVYGSTYETLDLVAASKEQYDLWVNGLRYLVAEVAKADKITVFLRQAWRKADRNNDNKLTLDEILRLLRQLNVNLSRKQVKATFDEASKGQNYMDFPGFTAFYKALKYRKDVEDLFRSLAVTHQGHSMTLAEFSRFLTDQQKENVTEKQVSDLIAKYSDGFAVDKTALSLDGFSRYLNSEDAEGMNRTHATTVYQNMNLPLNYYYVNSSHNTYLMKDQLRGPSSVEAYIHALTRGCRSVELDCWDGPDKDPIVYHGHTLVSKIKFRDVVQAINEYAFKASPYPVSLSLEVHCSLEQQGIMARILKDILKDKLYVVPITSVQQKLPSPNELKNKILVKGKALPAELKVEEYESDEDADDDEEDENDPKAQEAAKLKAEQGKKKGGKVKVHKDLSDLVNCLKSVHFKSFEDSRAKAHANEICSFVETKSIKFSKHHSSDYIEFNSISMTRTYPKGSRVDSSNYDPQPHWRHGAHIVALNYQTYDRALQLSLGKFADNGNCGYLVKPPQAMKYNPSIYQQAPLPAPKKLSIRVVSAFQLPKPQRHTKGEIIDPFVEVELVDDQEDHALFKTKVVKDNGFNPTFNETFEFRVNVPELALVRFVVMEHDIEKSEFIAARVIPFTSLMQGFRNLVLYDYQHRVIQLAALHVHITISD